MSRISAPSSGSEAPSANGLMSKMAAFALGLSVSTGVIYVLIIGNTPVYIGYFVATLVVAAFLVKDFKSLRGVMATIDPSVLLFFGIAALSLIVSFGYCLTGQFDIDAPLTVLKGLVTLVAGIFVYVAALLLRDCSKMVIWGVAVGIMINALISVIEQVAFESNSVFSLITYFPQDAFVVPLKWGTPEPAGSHAIYEFRAQGLFLEASHLMVFLVTWGVLCVIQARHTFVKAIILVSICYMAALALSPNIALLIIEAVLALVLVRHVDPQGLRKTGCKVPHETIVALIVLVFLGSLVVISSGDIILSAAEDALNTLADLNPLASTDTGTTERFDSMLSALSILPNYPLGAGWNTESLVLTAHFGGEVFASHSFALRLLIEIGPLGLACYCWLVTRHAKRAFRVSRMGRLLGIAIICMTIVQFMNGITLLPYVWLVLGLAKGIELDRRQAVEGRSSNEMRVLAQEGLHI